MENNDISWTIGCSLAEKTPLIIIKEAIYSRLLELPYKQGQFTNFELDCDVAPLKLSKLFHKYTIRFGCPPGINSSKDFKKIRLEMAAALRHRDCDIKLCYAIAQKTLDKGLPYVMAGAGREARILKQLAKEVALEVNQHKVLEFQYNLDSPRVIFTYCNLIHNTADLILKHYSTLYPERTILIYTRREAFWVKDGLYEMANLNEFNMDRVYGRQLAAL